MTIQREFLENFSEILREKKVQKRLETDFCKYFNTVILLSIHFLAFHLSL